MRFACKTTEGNIWVHTHTHTHTDPENSISFGAARARLRCMFSAVFHLNVDEEDDATFVMAPRRVLFAQVDAVSINVCGGCLDE